LGEKMKNKYAVALSVVAIVGVLATMLSNALDNPETPLMSALTSLKYFTIQSNIFIAVYFGVASTKYFSQKKWFSDLLGAVLVYITITFLVFAVMLQGTWRPEGLAQFGNILNHYLVPLSAIAFLVWFRNDYQFHWNSIYKWITYPLVYIIFLLIHGIITTDYIYPFFEIDELGIGYFLITFLGIMCLFFLLSWGAISLTKKK